MRLTSEALADLRGEVEMAVRRIRIWWWWLNHSDVTVATSEALDGLVEMTVHRVRSGWLTTTRNRQTAPEALADSLELLSNYA